MPVNATSVRFPLDSATVFRAYGSSAIVVDGGTTALAVDTAAGYWAKDNAGNQINSSALQFAVVIDVTAITTTDSTYKLAMEFDADGNFASGSVVTELQVSPTATGTYVIIVPRERIPAGMNWMRVYADITSSGSPSITFAAWMAPVT